MRTNRLALLLLLIASPAFAQQQPDTATLQRYLFEMQRARDERANEAVQWRAEVTRLIEEAAKLKAELDRLKAAPTPERSDGR